MAYIYAMSDIHGKLALFQEALSYLDLEKKENQLYLLGDYIDRGEDSLGTISLVRSLSLEKPEQVFPLLGNHELLLLSDLEEMYFSEQSIERLAGMLTEEEKKEIDLKKIYKVVRKEFLKLGDLVRKKRADLLEWIEDLNLFYETSSHIFVHAGINQEENWQETTDIHTLLWTRSFNTGSFYKDIIMGHTPTGMIANNFDFHGIYWDGEAHFYIDGHAFRVNQLQILRYDTESKAYFHFVHELKEFLPLIPYADL